KNRDPKRYLGWADVIIVVYSVTDVQSFEFAENLLKMIARHDHSLCNRPHTVCLYGNKIDIDRYRRIYRFLNRKR
uniref:small monomeric GTPase n=1 Tax=Romanomermis culicivorax TaxID=13658 RepID=A0A915IE69_ROMCU